MASALPAIVAMNAANMAQETARRAREQAHFEARCAQRPQPFTRVPVVVAPLGACKQRREDLQVALHGGKRGGAQRFAEVDLTLRVAQRALLVEEAYGRADLYRTLGETRRLKRCVHRLRVALRAGGRPLPLPPRASQWRGRPSDPGYSDVPRAEAARAWAGWVRRWCGHVVPPGTTAVVSA